MEDFWHKVNTYKNKHVCTFHIHEQKMKKKSMSVTLTPPPRRGLYKPCPPKPAPASPSPAAKLRGGAFTFSKFSASDILNTRSLIPDCTGRILDWVVRLIGQITLNANFIDAGAKVEIGLAHFLTVPAYIL